MYQLFIQKDLDLVEINPLGVSRDGKVMALDGKVSVNDDALGRHPDMAALMESAGNNQPAYVSNSPVAMESEGQIGILCNGAGLTMATLDLVCQAGGKPACFVNIGGKTPCDLSAEALRERLERGLEQMTQMKQVRVLLVNLVSSLIQCDEAAEVIAAYLNRRVREPRGVSEIRPDTLITHTVRIPQMVVRLVGKDHDRAKALLTGTQVAFIESLDEAVTQAVQLVKSVSRSA